MRSLLYIICLLISLASFSQNATNVNEVQYRVVAHQKFDNSVTSVSNTVSAIKKMKIQVPNAFSPDGDGINDDFMIVHDGIEEFSMQIYNRWGELVYQTDDTDYPWTGLYKGKDCQQDAYVYIISARGLEDENMTTIKGSVSLIR